MLLFLCIGTPSMCRNFDILILVNIFLAGDTVFCVAGGLSGASGFATLTFEG